MNWLIIPHVGKTTLKGESNFLLYLDVARFFAGCGDQIHFLVDVAAGAKELPAIEHVHYLRAKPAVRGLSYYNRMAILPPEVVEQCHRRRGSRMIDVVLTSRPFVVTALKNAVSAVDMDLMPVIYLEPGAEDKLRRIKGDAFRRSLCQAWLAADVAVFLTQREKEVALDLARAYCSGSEVRRFMEMMLVNPVGVPIDTADKYIKAEKADKFTLFFGARANDVKQLEDIYTLYDLVFRSGRDVRIVFATPTTLPRALKLIGKDRLLENPNVEFYSQLSRAEYMSLVSSSHVFCAWSKWEGFPVGFWEQMYLGLIGLFPRRPWALKQLPEDYPFFFSDLKDAFAQVCWIYDHYEEARAKVSNMPQLIRDLYRKDVVWDRLRAQGQLLKDLGRQHRLGQDMQEHVVTSVAALGNEFSLDDLITYVIQQSRRLPDETDMRAEDFRFAGNYDFFRYAEGLGLEYDLQDNGRRVVFHKDPVNAEENSSPRKSGSEVSPHPLGVPASR